MVLHKKRPTEEQVIDSISWTLGMPSSSLFPYLHFKDDLHLDAVDLQLLIIKLESRFNAFLTPEEVESIETVRDAIRLIKRYAALT